MREGPLAAGELERLCRVQEEIGAMWAGDGGPRTMTAEREKPDQEVDDDGDQDDG